MIDALLHRPDVAIEHRDVGAHAEAMRDAICWASLLQRRKLLNPLHYGLTGADNVADEILFDIDDPFVFRLVPHLVRLVQNAPHCRAEA